MKKITLSLLFALAFFVNIYGQETFFDDFESYNANFISPQSERWTTWGGIEGSYQQGDAYVIPDPTFSGINSLEIKGSQSFPSGGPTDMILKLGNLTSGVYELSFQLYFEDADGLHYNFQHFETPGQEWAFEVTCPSGGLINGQVDCQVDMGGGFQYFTIVRGEWTKFKHLIDLDNDEISLYFNDNLVQSWPFSWQVSETNGTKQLGGINFFPRNSFDAYVIDDVEFNIITSTDDIEDLASKNRLFPTVSSGKINLELGTAWHQEILSAEIWNINGQQLEQFILRSSVKEEIDIGSFPLGSYLLVLRNESGEVVDRLKFFRI